MSISIRDVQVGHFFVYGSTVREIIADLGKNVKYRPYLLENGEPTHTFPSMCSKKRIFRWAEREATPEEVARMKCEKAGEVYKQTIQDFGIELMNAISDESLLEEVHRRGLDKQG